MWGWKVGCGAGRSGKELKGHVWAGRWGVGLEGHVRGWKVRCMTETSCMEMKRSGLGWKGKR